MKSFTYWVLLIIIVLSEGLLARKLGITASYIESLSTGGYILYMLGIIGLMFFNYILFAFIAKNILIDKD